MIIIRKSHFHDRLFLLSFVVLVLWCKSGNNVWSSANAFSATSLSSGSTPSTFLLRRRRRQWQDFVLLSSSRQIKHDDGTSLSVLSSRGGGESSSSSEPFQPLNGKESPPSFTKRVPNKRPESFISSSSTSSSSSSAMEDAKNLPLSDEGNAALLDEEADKVRLSPLSASSLSSESTIVDDSNKQQQKPKRRRVTMKRKMELFWCNKDHCKEAVRERVVGNVHNEIILNGPATGQVVYHWKNKTSSSSIADAARIQEEKQQKTQEQVQQQPLPKLNEVLQSSSSSSSQPSSSSNVREPSVFLLVKKGDDRLLQLAADAVEQLTSDKVQVNVLLDPSTAARLEHYHGVGRSGNKLSRIGLFESIATPGYGSCSDLQFFHSSSHRFTSSSSSSSSKSLFSPVYDNDDHLPDLIVTLGGDGLLMHASMMFQGPCPPILCIAGGSLGFLTPFSPDELVHAVQVALGLKPIEDDDDEERVNQGEEQTVIGGKQDSTFTSTAAAAAATAPYSAFDNVAPDVFPPNMPSYPYPPINDQSASTYSKPFVSGRTSGICLSIRMRLECCIMNRDGRVRARYNVLNEVVIDRGSSPYLAALECFCDDVHLTTVQADGVIFATPTGSTAYSLAAGSSVVHPSVPCILVTPICPHVLSFRSMVFPDHVVLRCYVPESARSEASVAFDGKFRQELRRGDSVEIKLSPYPVPTINRRDHSSDWLDSLKRNLYFNARPRQQPLL